MSSGTGGVSGGVDGLGGPRERVESLTETSSSGRTPARLVGLDVARAVALIGMVAVHVVPATRAFGAETAVHPLHLVFGGRSSALFAVLAGLALALTSGRAVPPGGQALRAARRATLARAGIVLVIGLTLGGLQSGVAVILVNYAVLFAAVLPWLGLRWRAVATWAAGWLLLSPVLSHVVRGALDPGPGPVPSWLSLADPVELVVTVLFTGYYPVLTWTGYLLVGLAVGRSPLLAAAGQHWRAALQLAIGGAMLAVLAWLVSLTLLRQADPEALTVPLRSTLSGTPLDIILATSSYGTTPTTSWWWLAAAGPHSGTPFDLLHTTGTALAVIGLCLLAGGLTARPRAVAAVLVPFAAAGSMTLTLYTGHVLALALTRDSTHDARTWVTHVLVALAVATAWRAGAQALDRRVRGPLEAVASMAADAARGPSTPPPRAGDPL